MQHDDPHKLIAAETSSQAMNTFLLSVAYLFRFLVQPGPHWINQDVSFESSAWSDQGTWDFRHVRGRPDEGGAVEPIQFLQDEEKAVMDLPTVS